MIVSAAAHETEAVAFHAIRERAGVLHDLLLVFLEGRLRCFFQADGFGGNDVHERSALNSGERLRINFLRILCFAQDQSATRATQRLVRRRRDKVRVCHRTGMLARRDETGDVGDVREQQRADFARDLAHALEVDDS